MQSEGRAAQSDALSQSKHPYLTPIPSRSHTERSHARSPVPWGEDFPLLWSVCHNSDQEGIPWDEPWLFSSFPPLCSRKTRFSSTPKSSPPTRSIPTPKRSPFAGIKFSLSAICLKSKKLLPTPTRTDLDGKSLFPGFIDSHSHTIDGGLNLIHADATDKVDTLTQLPAFVAEAKKSGRGMHGDILEILGLPLAFWSHTDTLNAGLQHGRLPETGRHFPRHGRPHRVGQSRTCSNAPASPPII